MSEPVAAAMDASTVQYAGFLLDKFGAPKLSELSECNAPPLEDPPNYLGSLILNGIFTVNYPDPLGRLALIFGRRVIHAIREYSIARERLSAYVAELERTNSHFLQAMRATTHFESSVGSACQACALLGRISKLVAEPEPNDEREDRLRKIWNRSKHFDEDLMDPRIGSTEITAPVWLTNQGISSTAASVSFDELHAVLTDLRGSLKFLAEDFPNKFAALQKERSKKQNTSPT
jgi:hypothetical protein